MPGKDIQEASTFGINEQSYVFDALGYYVQGDVLEPMPGNTQEASTFGFNDVIFSILAVTDPLLNRGIFHFPFLILLWSRVIARRPMEYVVILLRLLYPTPWPRDREEKRENEPPAAPLRDGSKKELNDIVAAIVA
jgi:hypothetical protein